MWWMWLIFVILRSFFKLWFKPRLADGIAEMPVKRNISLPGVIVLKQVMNSGIRVRISFGRDSS